jgi:hypothetical protein
VDRIVGATGLLPALRRKLYHEATDLMQKQVIKSTRWLLLKNPENLDQNRQEAERLEKALRLNQPLPLANYLKEDLRQFWKQPRKATAAAFLEDCIARAQTAGIPFLLRFSKTLALHRRGFWPITITRSLKSSLLQIEGKIAGWGKLTFSGSQVGKLRKKARF